MSVSTRQQQTRRRTGGTSRPNKVNAGLGGAGGGTALVAFAQHLGVNTWPGLVLLYCTPLISIVFGAGIGLVQLWAVRIGEQSVVSSARKTIKEQLNNPNITEEHKADLQAKLQELDQIIAEQQISRVKAAFDRIMSSP